MKKYAVIKRYSAIDTQSLVQVVDNKQDAFAMRDILKRANPEYEFFVFQLIGQ